MVENVLNIQFLIATPSKVWVSDIIYIYTKERPLMIYIIESNWLEFK